MEGKLRPPEEILQDLGLKLLAIAMRGGIVAKNMAFTIKDTPVEGIDPRMVESYAVPTAMLAVAGGYDEAWARATLLELTGNIDKADQGRVDHEQLMVDILAASVNLGGKGIMTVGQIIESPTGRGDYTQRLEAAGIRVLSDAGRDTALFIAHRVAGPQLLKGSPWEGQKIDQVLVRLKGATRGARKLGGTTQRGILVPIESTGLDLPSF